MNERVRKEKKILRGGVCAKKCEKDDQKVGERGEREKQLGLLLKTQSATFFFNWRFR